MVTRHGKSVIREFLIRLTEWINKFQETSAFHSNQSYPTSMLTLFVLFVLFRFVLVRVVSRLSKKSYKQYINNSIAHISSYEIRCECWFNQSKSNCYQLLTHLTINLISAYHSWMKTVLSVQYKTNGHLNWCFSHYFNSFSKNFSYNAGGARHIFYWYDFRNAVGRF